MQRLMRMQLIQQEVRHMDGDVVLLSPASTSFDMFRNFEERGNLFKKIVNELN